MNVNSISEGSWNNGWATQCYMDCYHRFGGMVGENAGSVLDSKSVCDGTFTFISKSQWGRLDRMVGGIVGFNRGTLRNVFASGSIVENSSGDNITEFQCGLGGIVGWQDQGSINTCQSLVNMTVTNSESHGWVGGIAGYQNESNSIFNAYYEGSITTTKVEAIGGLCGKCEGNITSAVAKPTSMTCDAGNVGVLVGEITAKGGVNKVLYYGTVDDAAVGQNAGFLQNAYRIDLSTAYTYLTAAEMYDKSILSRDIWGLEEGKSVYLLAFAE